MEERAFTVKAMWDEEAGVWSVFESDVPGLVAEAESIPALAEKLRILVPEMLELNAHLLDWEPKGELPIHVHAEYFDRVRVNS